MTYHALSTAAGLQLQIKWATPTPVCMAVEHTPHLSVPGVACKPSYDLSLGAKFCRHLVAAPFGMTVAWLPQPWWMFPRTNSFVGHVGMRLLRSVGSIYPPIPIGTEPPPRGALWLGTFPHADRYLMVQILLG